MCGNRKIVNHTLVHDDEREERRRHKLCGRRRKKCENNCQNTVTNLTLKTGILVRCRLMCTCRLLENTQKKKNFMWEWNDDEAEDE